MRKVHLTMTGTQVQVVAEAAGKKTRRVIEYGELRAAQAGLAALVAGAERARAEVEVTLH